MLEMEEMQKMQKRDNSRISGTLGLRLLLLWVVTLPVSAQIAPFPGLRVMMSDAEYVAAGLEGLSVAERANLNRWLASYATFVLPDALPESAAESQQQTTPSTQPPASAKGSGAAQFPPKKIDRSRSKEATIVSRYVGEFRGWKGRTLFRLENGQVWLQRQRGRYFFKAESPELQIFRNRLGFYTLRVTATGRQIGVKLIEE
jgi:hypothetical protein